MWRQLFIIDFCKLFIIKSIYRMLNCVGDARAGSRVSASLGSFRRRSASGRQCSCALGNPGQSAFNHSRGRTLRSRRLELTVLSYAPTRLLLLYSVCAVHRYIF